MINIRLAKHDEFEQIWPFFHSIVSAGDTYAIDPEIDREDAQVLWLEYPECCYVVEKDDEIVASYYLKTNQAGPGSHVCNCGYMVADAHQGQGIAREMCLHSQGVAIELGYRAMQFNFVAASNEGAVGLWLKLGFEIVGTLPKAFNHPTLGLVDAYVMYKTLQSNDNE